MCLPLRGNSASLSRVFCENIEGDHYPLWVVVDEVFFDICNILLYSAGDNYPPYRVLTTKTVLR